MHLRLGKRHGLVTNLYWNYLSFDQQSDRVECWMCFESWPYRIMTPVDANLHLVLEFFLNSMSALKKSHRRSKSWVPVLSECSPEAVKAVPIPCAPWGNAECPGMAVPTSKGEAAGCGERPRLLGWGALSTPRTVAVGEGTLPTEASRSPSRGDQLLSALCSWAAFGLLCILALKVRGLGFFLLLFLWIGCIVVEVNRGLHWETGQHLLPGTLQIFLTLWNG